MKICLLGPIPKGDEIRKNWTDWKIVYKNVLRDIGDVEFVDGDAWRDESNPQLTFGHDAYQIKQSDIIVVNAESKLGAGTAQEMVIAKYFNKLVVTVLPKDSHHRRHSIMFHGKEITDWIHPFILAFSDYVAENVGEAKKWIDKNNDSNIEVKGITVIDEAIQVYEDFVKE